MLNWNMSGTRARTHACMHDCTRLLDCAQRVFLQLREVAQIGAGGASIDAQMLLEQVGPTVVRRTEASWELSGHAGRVVVVA